MRRCRFCPHSVPVPGTTLRRPLQIYKKYPGFETKVTSFFSKPSVGRSLPSSPVRLLLSPFPVRFLVSPCRPLPSAFFCRFSRTLSRVALPPSPVRRVPNIHILSPLNPVALRGIPRRCGRAPGRGACWAIPSAADASTEICAPVRRTASGTAMPGLPNRRKVPGHLAATPGT